MTEKDAKQFVEQVHREKIEKDSPDLRAALRLLAEELNTKETHFILELLQNAEDNQYDGKQPELTLRIDVDDPTGTSSHGCLLVLNNEVGFQPENVRGVCSVGQSTKKNRSNAYIGEKGIGFKSVFRVTDSPHIFSNGFQFRFHVPTELEGFGYILPHWVNNVPPVAADGVTTILLPLRAGKRELIALQLSKIAPETILFLRKLKRLTVSNARSISRDDAEGSLVTLRSNGEDASLYFVHSKPCNKPQNVAEEKRPGVSQREVTVAFPLKTCSTCKGRIFAFLPTEFDSGLPFLVNTDFILNSNRERVLEDRHWNQWLRDEIAPTFVEAFLSILENPKWKTEAHRYLTELATASDFVRPVVNSIQTRLQSQRCVLTDLECAELPENVFVPGPFARQALSDVPRDRLGFALLHPSWESRWQERLKPLGVRSLTFAQLFEACSDEDWLQNRDAEWWVNIMELCANCDASTDTIGTFPILRCHDGKCRPLSSGVFLASEDRPAISNTRSEWPPAHFFDADLQSCLQQKPAVWAWLTRVAALRSFSVQAYIAGSLLDWMCEQTGERAAERLVEATRFISANLKNFDEDSQLTPALRRLRVNQVHKNLQEKVPWLLADGQILLPEARASKKLVTPECLEGDTGWNLLFPPIDRHFFVIHNAYCAGLSQESLAELQELFKACGATEFPDPNLREISADDPHYDAVLTRCAQIVYGRPKLRDWAAPCWLRSLQSSGHSVDTLRKIAALERWLNALGPINTTKVLHSCKLDYENKWQQIDADSEFGLMLRTKAWLHTSKGHVPPPAAYLDTPEFREFFGDSVPYVGTEIAVPLLEKLGVRVHLTAEVLIAQLREISGKVQTDLSLLSKIYRRLHDSTFDAGIFGREKLVFLSEPKPRWLSTGSLVWQDAGELFDDDFGYVELTYGNSDLRHFFIERLKIPPQPELTHYASAWKNLWLTSPPDRQTTERKLKAILPRLAASPNEFAGSDWWLELKPQLRIWTDREEFLPPSHVYVPDHSTAVELFAGRIHIAFPPKPTGTVLEFLRSLACRSLAATLQTRLCGTAGESMDRSPICLTPGAKELCVLLVCSRKGWEDRRLHLEALLETTEVGVTEITVEYWLKDNREVGTQPLPRDAHWDVDTCRLLLRDGVDPESLRDAAAKAIAVEFFGEATSAEMQAEFFLVLTVGLDRARKLMRERSNWRLKPEQQAWLRKQLWQILITELDEVEQPPVPRSSAESMPVNPPVASASISPPTSSSENAVAGQATVTTANQPGSTAPSQRSQEVPRSSTQTTSQGQARQTQSAADTPAELHAADETTADFVEVSAHARSRPQRQRPQQTQENHREATSGLTTTSADDKAALEQCGREFAAKKLANMGYTVTPMSKHNPGFDLKAEKPGGILKVEVKAHGGNASSVFVTQREWEEYLRTRDLSGQAWELWNVENLAKSFGKKPTIQRVRHIPKSAKKESGYWIDLNQCFEEPPP
jgi:hypothetical protein